MGTPLAAAVLSDGKIITYLNHNLIEKQNVSPDDVESLKATHIVKHFLFAKAREAVKNESFAHLLELDKLRTELEYFQQDLWGFPRDSKMHGWYDMPGCECPKMDNKDRRGTIYQIYSEDCPIHGNRDIIDSSI